MIKAKGASYKLNGADAVGFFIGEQFGVLSGAEVHPVKKSLREAVAKGSPDLRERLENEKKIENDKLKVDYVFDSPSQAGDVILGTTGGGPEKWINEDTHISISEERKQGESKAIKFSRMGKMLIAVFGMTLSLLCGGCGKGQEWHSGSQYLVDFGSDDTLLSILDFLGGGTHISLNYADALYYDSYRNSYGGYRRPGSPSDACGMRIDAVMMARQVWTYSFKNYTHFDGVSSFIYNVGYICSVPHKILRGLRTMDGVFCYAGAIVKLAFGTVAATVGLVVGPVMGLLSHPFSTLANLTVGVIPVNYSETFDSVGQYLWYTNILASLWDLVWGAILAPLLQTFIFWW